MVCKFVDALACACQQCLSASLYGVFMAIPAVDLRVAIFSSRVAPSNFEQ
jgi:hypothetical protein